MSISKGRIDNAYRAWLGGCCVSMNPDGTKKDLERLLEADDVFTGRATHQPAAPGTDSEPELPMGYRFVGIDCHGVKYEGPNHETFHPTEATVAKCLPLYQHADFALRRQRTLEQEAPAFTESMARDVWTEWSLPKQNGSHTFIELARLMNNALAEAQRSEARKEVTK